jgi:hypothetical protein
MLETEGRSAQRREDVSHDQDSGQHEADGFRHQRPEHIAHYIHASLTIGIREQAKRHTAQRPRIGDVTGADERHLSDSVLQNKELKDRFSTNEMC